MLDTVHVLTGLVLGRYIENPFLAFCAGVASHFALDAMPHWDGDKSAKWEKDPNGKLCAVPNKEAKTILVLDMMATTAVFLAFIAFGKIMVPQPTISFWQFFTSHWSWWTGMLGGLFPDILLLGYLFFGWSKPAWLFQLEFHKKLQTRKMKRIPGLVMQAIMVIALMVLFVR